MIFQDWRADAAGSEREGGEHDDAEAAVTHAPQHAAHALAEIDRSYGRRDKPGKGGRKPAEVDHLEMMALHGVGDGDHGDADGGGGAADAIPLPSKVRVTARALNVRSKPKVARRNIVGSFRRGHETVALGRDGDWLLIGHESGVAYINATYVEPVEAGGAEPEAGHRDPASGLPNGKRQHQPIHVQHDHDASSPLPAPHPSPAPASAPRHDAAPTPVADHGAADHAAASSPPEPPAAALPPPSFHSFEEYVRLAAISGNPQALSITQDLTVLQAKFDMLPKQKAGHTYANEEQGNRQEAVALILPLRAKIQALSSAGLDPATTGALQSSAYRAIADMSPYYSQWWNANILHKDGSAARGRTCNVTSVAMALEALGRTAQSYQGERQAFIVAAAHAFHGELHLKAHPTWEAVKALRLADFLQLVVVARFMHDASAAAAHSAQETAASSITSSSVVHYAKEFGVKPQIIDFDRGADFKAVRGKGMSDLEILKSHGHKFRRGIELSGQFGIQHNNFLNEGGTEEGWWQSKAGKAERAYLDRQGSTIDKTMDLESYKNTVITQVGKDLDSGAAIFAVMYNHFTRLQAIHPDAVVIDDPGSWSQSDYRMTWEEARACGLFLRWAVLRG